MVGPRSSRKSLQMITFYEWKNMFLKFQDLGRELWSKALTLCCCSHPRRSHTYLVKLSIQGARIPLTTSSSLDSEHSVAFSNWLQLLMSVETKCSTVICHFGKDAKAWAPRLALALCHLRCFQCIPRLSGMGSFSVYFSPKQSAADFHRGCKIQWFRRWARYWTWAIKCRLWTSSQSLVLCLKVL